MLIQDQAKAPRIRESAYVAPTATLCGDVRIGAHGAGPEREGAWPTT